MSIPDEQLKRIGNLAPEDKLLLIAEIANYRAERNNVFRSESMHSDFDAWVESLLNSDLILLIGELICLVPEDFE
jgi:hypothetical protein